MPDLEDLTVQQRTARVAADRPHDEFKRTVSGATTHKNLAGGYAQVAHGAKLRSFLPSLAERSARQRLTGRW